MTQLSPGEVLADLDVRAAIAAALETVRRNIGVFGERYPCDTTSNGRYPLRKAQSGLPEGANSGWTTGFWPGMLWLAWELSDDDEEEKQRKLLDHLLLGYIREAGIIHGAKGGDHAEQRNAENHEAGPEVSGSFESVVKELR